MNLKTIILSLFAVILSVMPARAFSGQWKLHPTFDEGVSRVIDTPGKVYMLALGQPIKSWIPEATLRKGFLYVYDKDADELTILDSSNSLSNNIITNIEYNASAGYLVIVYEDYDIDLLYDDGHAVNISSLKNASIPASRNINGITFDPERGLIYMATDFGFMVLNDRKGEVYATRIYNRPFRSAARLGDYIILSDSEGLLYSAKASDPNFTFADFTPIDASAGLPEDIDRLFQLNKDILGLIGKSAEGSEYNRDCYVMTVSGVQNGVPAFTASKRGNLDVKSVSMAKDGYYIWRYGAFAFVSSAGEYKHNSLPADLRNNQILGSHDGREIWEGAGRKGLRSFKKTGEEWSLTRDFMRPNAPAVFVSQSMQYHPNYGMLVSNRGNRSYFTSVTNYKIPILLSSLSEGAWEMYGLPYTNYPEKDMMHNPSGLAIDPKNPDFVYFGSSVSGIGRINLRNPEDVLHFGNTKNDGASLPSFVELVPEYPTWPQSCTFTDPYFDAQGNLWTLHNNLDSENYSELWVWPRANIDATTGPKNWKPWITLPIKSPEGGLSSLALPLTSAANNTKVIVALSDFEGCPLLYDHRGTLENKSDDKQVRPVQVFDQDGQTVRYNYIRTFYEDKNTGLVWVGTDMGVFTLNPSTYIDDPTIVHRVKVSRDDGTSLADYLLHGVDVSSIIEDPFGRKWFGTVGGGLVCTSGDGRMIKGEWTTENSLLPSNDVFGIGWNEETGSIMVSTSKGLAEYFPAGEGTGADFNNLKVYPNPVRPDYHGWININGLTDGALVKITDAHGNMVRELGRAEGGSIQWDATNVNGRRVSSGVYYILASDTGSASSLAKVGKILIVN